MLASSRSGVCKTLKPDFAVAAICLVCGQFGTIAPRRLPSWPGPCWLDEQASVQRRHVTCWPASMQVGMKLGAFVSTDATEWNEPASSRIVLAWNSLPSFILPMTTPRPRITVWRSLWRYALPSETWRPRPSYWLAYSRWKSKRERYGL